MGEGRESQADSSPQRAAPSQPGFATPAQTLSGLRQTQSTHLSDQFRSPLDGNERNILSFTCMTLDQQTVWVSGARVQPQGGVGRAASHRQFQSDIAH